MLKYWIPIIGIYFVWKDSEHFRYPTDLFVGYAWEPYQRTCVLSLIIAVCGLSLIEVVRLYFY